MPSRMASRIPPKFGFGGRSGLRIAIAQTVASANAPHCTAIARLGPNASINWPPSAGPLTIPVAQTVESSPWARPNCAGPTICAIAPKAAASANVRAMPIAKATLEHQPLGRRARDRPERHGQRAQRSGSNARR